MSNKKWEAFVQEIIKLPENELRRRSQVLRSKIQKIISMKTKEEIIYELASYDEGGALYPRSIVEKSMDEWAISFGKWVQGCNYAPATEEGKWQNQLPGENDIITTEELYRMFENKNK